LLLILLRISLLILPISDLDVISRHVGLLAKFGLWSFSDLNVSLLAVVSILSSIVSLAVMFLFSSWMLHMLFGCDFVM